MDKLAPILKYKFWILLALVPILSVAGWWIGIGKLQELTTEREGKIEQAFSTTGSITAASPNESWATDLKVYNDRAESELVQATETLFQSQINEQVWPTRVLASIESQYPDGDYKYRDNLEVAVGDTYRREYKRYITREIAPILEPFHVPANISRSAFEKKGTGFGKMVVEWENIPFDAIGVTEQRAMTSEEMWDAQEDLWLMTSIFKAIASVNKGSATIANSRIKVLHELQFRGGNAAEIAARQSGEPTEDGSGAPGMDGEVTAMEGAGGLGAGGFRFNDAGGTRAGGAANIQVNLDVDFGSDAATGEATSPDGDTPVEESDPLMASGGGLTQEKRRYIEDGSDGAPFQTRGFYLVVTMDHNDLPEFITELKKSKWPVTITRIHQSDIDQSTVTVRDIGATDDPGIGVSPAGPTGFGQPGLARSSGSTFQKEPFENLEGNARTRQYDPRLISEANSLHSKAMREPYLTQIAIAGWMTMYREPKEETEGEEPTTEGTETETAPDVSTDPGTEEGPATEPPADGTEDMTDPGATGTSEPSGDSDMTTQPEPDNPTDEGTSEGSTSAQPATTVPE